jgi:hypothetical protein
MKAKHRRNVAGLIALTALTGITACNSTSSSTAGSSSGDILIGLAAPITGTSPSEGISEEKIANDAIAAINSHGGVNGRQLKLVIRDTGGVSPTGAVSAFESLSSAGVAMVIGEYTSTNFRAGCTIAMAEHMVLLGRASATTGLTDGKSYCFRDAYQVSQSAGAMFTTAKAQGWNPIGIAADTTSFGSAEETMRSFPNWPTCANAAPGRSAAVSSRCSPSGGPLSRSHVFCCSTNPPRGWSPSCKSASPRPSPSSGRRDHPCHRRAEPVLRHAVHAAAVRDSARGRPLLRNLAGLHRQ